MEEFSNTCEVRRQEIDQMFDYLVDNLGSADVKAMMLFLCDLRQYFDDMRLIKPFHCIDETDEQIAQFYAYLQQKHICVWVESFTYFLMEQELMDLSISRDQLEQCFSNS